MTILPNPDWYSRGACATAPDPDVFHPDGRNNGADAKVFCRRCPVVEECLRYALTHPVEGVWGCTTESERRKINDRRAVARA